MKRKNRYGVARALRPGMPGTKKHMQKYGKKLLMVRYRYDLKTKTRFTTVEIIVDSGPMKRKE